MLGRKATDHPDDGGITYCASITSRYLPGLTVT